MFLPQIHPYLPNTELLLWCKEKNIHVTAYAPLGNVNKEFASCLDDPVIIEIAERMTKSPAQVMYTHPIQSHRNDNDLRGTAASSVRLSRGAPARSASLAGNIRSRRVLTLKALYFTSLTTKGAPNNEIPR